MRRQQGRRAATGGPAPVTAVRGTSMAVAALAAAALPVFLTGALQGRIAEDLGIGTGAIGTAIAAFFIAGAATSIPGGRLVDRLGAPLALRLGMLVATFAAVGVALGADDRWKLTLGLAIAGTALALVDPGGARALTASVPRDRLGFAFGAKEASIPLASLLAGLVLPLLGAHLGWRPAFYLGAGIAVVTALVIPSGLDPSVRPGGGRRAPTTSSPSSATASSPEVVADAASGVMVSDLDTSATRTGDAVTGDEAAEDPSRSTVGDATSPSEPVDGTSTSQSDDVDPPSEIADGAARSSAPSATVTVATSTGTAPLLAGLAATAALAGGVAAAVAAFLVPSAQVAGLSPGAAGLLLSVASLASVAMRLASGLLVDRHQGSELRMMAWLTGVGAVGVALLALLTGPIAGGAGGPADVPASLAITLLVAAGIAAMGGGWGWTGLVFLAAVRLEPTRPARAAGTVLAGLGVGGSLGPAILGSSAERVGFAGTWTAGSVAMAIGCVGVVLLRRRMPRQGR